MKQIQADNFVKTFKEFENRLNSFFQGKTKFLKGGDVKISRNSIYYRYEKRIVSKTDTDIEIKILYDKEKNDYLYYTYNILFNQNKLMFHYEPTHREHFQPHINVYIQEKELKNINGEGIHILSHKYHPFEIIDIIERYFG